ncbi:MAG: BBP7 family outer membrane beta-barrel protein [Planctomycetaceae bacterium]
MTRISTLLTTCLIVTGIFGAGNSSWAQYGPGGPAGSPAYPPPAYGPPAADYSHVGYPQYGGPPSFSGPAGFRPVEGVQFCDSDGIAIRQLPEDRGWGYQDTPADRLLKDVARDSWIRIEYLNWDFERPGDTLLGEPVQFIDNPRIPFDVFAGGVLIGQARVPDTNDIRLSDVNGIRGTFGIPTTMGDFEANFFGFQNEKHLSVARDLPSDIPPELGTFVGTSTLVNGALGDNIFLYDNSFQAEWESKIWGTEANFIISPDRGGEGLKLRPMGGFRYINIREGLNQRGVFDSFGFLAPLTSTIESQTNNNIYGPQIGLRAELVHRWFTFAVEPKVMLGMNSYQDSVTTTALRSFADPTVKTTASDTDVAAGAELGVNARIRLTDSLFLTVGYNLLWFGNVQRPHEIIRYNDNGPFPNPPDVVTNPNRGDMRLQGLSVGGEFRFR